MRAALANLTIRGATAMHLDTSPASSRLHVRGILFGVCVGLAGISFVMMLRSVGVDGVVASPQSGTVTADGGRVLSGGVGLAEESPPSPRAEAFDEVARAYLEVGDVGLAINSAESITDSNRRDVVLSFIADRLIPRPEGLEEARRPPGEKDFDLIVACLATVEKIGDGLARVELLAKIAKASRAGGPSGTDPTTILARARALAGTLSPKAARSSRDRPLGAAASIAWGVLGTISLGALGLIVSGVLTPLIQELTKDVAVPVMKARIGQIRAGEAFSNLDCPDKRIA